MALDFGSNQQVPFPAKNPAFCRSRSFPFFDFGSFQNQENDGLMNKLVLNKYESKNEVNILGQKINTLGQENQQMEFDEENKENENNQSDDNSTELKLKSISSKYIKWNDCEDNKLGHGGFSIVYKGTWKKMDVALKMPKPTQSVSMEKAIEIFKKEAKHYQRLNHPNIATFYGICIETPFCLVLELCHGKSLHSLLSEMSHPIHIQIMHKWAFQTANGMQHLHDKGIIHADLKSPNILLKEQPCLCENNGPEFSFDNYQANGLCNVCRNMSLDRVTLKIIDFNISRSKDSTRIRSDGTKQWTAPEILQKETPHTKWSDVYSFGVVLWEMVTRKKPFGRLNDIQFYHKVSNNKLFLSTPDNCPPTLRTLIKECRTFEFEKRPLFPEIISKLETAFGDNLIQEERNKQSNKNESLSPKNNLSNEVNLQLFQNGGINFLSKFIGTIELNPSVDIFGRLDQKNAGSVCITKITQAMCGFDSSRLPDSNSHFFLNEGTEIMNKMVHLNIDAKAVRIIETDQMPRRILLHDIQCIIPGTNDLNGYFCLFVKSNSNKQNADKLSIRCLVFFAGSEMGVICKTIASAFKIGTKQLNGSRQILDFKLLENLPHLKRQSKMSSSLKIGKKKLRLHNEINIVKWRQKNFQNIKPVVNQEVVQENNVLANISNELTQEQCDIITRNLSNEPWFHDILSRDAAEKLFCKNKNGQFLVRQSDQDHRRIILDVMEKDKIRHICLVDHRGFLRSNNGEFKTVSELIHHHYTACLYKKEKISFPATNQILAVLTKPICKSKKGPLIKKFLNVLKKKNKSV